MDLHTVATVLPTAVSASLYAGVHTTFLLEMLARRPAPLPAPGPWVSILKPVAGADDELREQPRVLRRPRLPGLRAPDRRRLARRSRRPRRRGLPRGAPRAAGAPRVDEAGRTAPAITPRSRSSSTSPAGRGVRAGRLRRQRARAAAPTSAALVDRLLRPGVGLVSLGDLRQRRALARRRARERAARRRGGARGGDSAHRVFGRPITVGKSMAMRRADLERVGGWESVAGVLAEDDVLGQRFHALGYGVELCASTRREPQRRRRPCCARSSATPAGRRCAAPSPPPASPCEPLLSPLLDRGADGARPALGARGAARPRRAGPPDSRARCSPTPSSARAGPSCSPRSSPCAWPSRSPATASRSRAGASAGAATSSCSPRDRGSCRSRPGSKIPAERLRSSGIRR